jgi:hypothetical protein
MAALSTTFGPRSEEGRNFSFGAPPDWAERSAQSGVPLMHGRRRTSAHLKGQTAPRRK